MTFGLSDISPRQAAVVAGAGYLVIFVVGFFAEFFVRANLVAPGDAAATAGNILESAWQFRAGIVGYLIAAVVDLLVALALYVFLKPVSAGLSLLAAWFRAAHAVILAVATGHLLSVVRLLGDAAWLSAIETGQRHAQAMVLLEAFDDAWLIGLVFFGLHCLVLGYLILKSSYVPRILGVLLMVAALGYLVDSFANFLLPNYSDYETLFLVIVAVPAVIGELSLCLWLLLKGGKGTAAGKA